MPNSQQPMTPESEAALECSSAGYTLGRKTGKGADPAVLEPASRELGKQLTDKKAAAEIDVRLFDPQEAGRLITEYGKTAVVLKNFSMSARFDREILSAFTDEKSPVRSLALKNGTISSYSAGNKFPYIEKLALSDTAVNAYTPDGLPKNSLRELKVERCRSEQGTFIGDTVLDMAAQNPLRKLTMREMTLLSGETPAGKPFDWSKLPLSVEYLNLSKTDVMNANFDALADTLPKLKNLKVLEIASCGLTDEHAQKLAKALEQSGVKHVNLSGNRFSENGHGVLNRLNGKNTVTGDYFEWHGAEINKMMQQTRPIEEAAKLCSTKQDIVNKGLFAAAAKSDSFEDVLKMLKSCGEYLKPADYLTPAADGTTILSDLVVTKQVDAAFKPEYWKNTKDMQTVWNALSPEGRAQLGENGGTAAFQRRKNQVMMNAVRQATARSGGR